MERAYLPILTLNDCGGPTAARELILTIGVNEGRRSDPAPSAPHPSHSTARDRQLLGRILQQQPYRLVGWYIQPQCCWGGLSGFGRGLALGLGASTL